MTGTRPWKHPGFAGLIGVAREDITPPKGIYARNWGAAAHDVASGVHRPLTATALALQSAPGEPPLVLVAADLGWWRTADDESRLRSFVLRELDLDPARLMVAFSHTHSGPALCREDIGKPGGDLIDPYLRYIERAIANAALRATIDTHPGTLEWTYGRCDLACNRDLPLLEENRIACGFHPDAPADDTLLVGRAADVDGTPMATVVNYACHPTTLAWANDLISPDFVGGMRETVEAETDGAPCLFLQGSSGELAPRDQYTADTSVADANGRRLGFAVLSALAGMLPPCSQLAYLGVEESGASLAVWGHEPVERSSALTAEVGLSEVVLRKELDGSADDAACSERALAERRARKRRIREALGEGPSVRLPFWTWRIGDALMVGQPNEPYSDLQTGLRKQFGETCVAVISLANGPYCGYLPPERMYGENAYQVWQTPFERGSLERLSAEIGQTMRRLHSEAATA